MFIWMYFAFINLLGPSLTSRQREPGFGSNILVLRRIPDAINLHKRPWTTSHRRYSDGVCMSKKQKGILHVCKLTWSKIANEFQCITMYHVSKFIQPKHIWPYITSDLPTYLYTDVSHRQILYICINLAHVHTHTRVCLNKQTTWNLYKFSLRFISMIEKSGKIKWEIFLQRGWDKVECLSEEASVFALKQCPSKLMMETPILNWKKREASPYKQLYTLHKYYSTATITSFFPIVLFNSDYIF